MPGPDEKRRGGTNDIKMPCIAIRKGGKGGGGPPKDP